MVHEVTEVASGKGHAQTKHINGSDSPHDWVWSFWYVTDSSPLSYCTLNATYLPKEKCFFQLPGQIFSQSIDVQLVCKNNFANAPEVYHMVVQ